MTKLNMIDRENREGLDTAADAAMRRADAKDWGATWFTSADFRDEMTRRRVMMEDATLWEARIWLADMTHAGLVTDHGEGWFELNAFPVYPEIKRLQEAS
jgi:hypothetical protein